jgi:two-component system cell cycle response regulator
MKAKILLIEDNKTQAKETIAPLEKAGYEVIWESAGMSGFKTAVNIRPDLILLDVVLPDRDGHEVCRYIKMNEALRNVPVVMLTARSEVKDKVRGLNIGADDYLSKPFHEEELLARINAFLRIKRLQDELQGKNLRLEELLKKVELMAITDGGTGLFNRRHFMELLDTEFSRAKRYGSPLTCILLDIDHFKRINDTLGHQVGDSVLTEMARILQENFRNIEISARYGGEEFVVMLPETTIADARKAAQRLLEQIAGFSFKGLPRNHMVTVSMGLAGLPDSKIETKEVLIRAADHALYRAKKGGRNRIEVSTGDESVGSDFPLSS